MNRRVKSCGKDGQKAPLEIAGAISTFSHSFNNNKLDDRDHFLQNAKTSVASLRRLITPSRNADHNQPGILITFIGIRSDTSAVGNGKQRKARSADREPHDYCGRPVL
jgi:hypothetical protein